MLVRISGFGTNWWSRFGTDPQDPFRYTKHAAFYNSTGIRCGQKVRRHWVIAGLIRFNGAGNFGAHHVDSYIGKTFRCTCPVVAFGGNRVLFENAVSTSSIPDFFLVVVSNNRIGPIDFGWDYWRSEGTQPLAASQLRETQEAMLLMRPGDWVETTVGRWHLTLTDQLEAGASLQLK